MRPFPIVSIPLSDDDALRFDFGQPYRKTFEETLYGFQLVDYGELPANFGHYRAADQRRIALRMLAVAEVVAAGSDLEAGLFPVQDLTLDDALARLAALMSGGAAPG